MQSQHADPHDAIAAQLRDLASLRAQRAPERNATPATSPEPTSPEPENEPSFSAAPLNDNTNDIRVPASRRRAGRRIVLLVICAGVAATMAWRVYGDEMKQRLSYLVPQLLADTPAMQSADVAEPTDATSQAAASEPAAEPAPAPAQENSNVEPATPTPPAPATPAAEAPPTQATLPPELMQSIEAMTREIDSLKQTVEQLQTGQKQLSHDIAKISEQGTHHKITEQTPKPTSRPRRAPRPTADSRPVAPPQVHSQGHNYSQGIAHRESYIPPPAPTQSPPRPGESNVPRPPMPLQ